MKKLIILLMALVPILSLGQNPIASERIATDCLNKSMALDNQEVLHPTQTHQVQSSGLKDLTGELLITEGGGFVSYSGDLSTTINYNQLWITYTGDEEVNYTITVIEGGENEYQGPYVETYDLLNADYVSELISWDAQNNRYIIDLYSLVFDFYYDSEHRSWAGYTIEISIHADGYNDLSGEFFADISYDPTDDPYSSVDCPEISDPIYSAFAVFVTVTFTASTDTNSGVSGGDYYSDYDYGSLTYAIERRDEDYHVTVYASQRHPMSTVYGSTSKDILIPARACGISTSQFIDNEPNGEYFSFNCGYVASDEIETIEYGEKESFVVVKFDGFSRWDSWSGFSRQISIDGQLVSCENPDYYDEYYGYYEQDPISCVIDLLPYGDAFGGEHQIEVVAYNYFYLGGNHYYSLPMDTVLSFHPIETRLTPDALIIDVNSGKGGYDLFVNGEEVELSADGSGTPPHIYSLPRRSNQDYMITVQVGNKITKEIDGVDSVVYQGRSQETAIVVPARGILATSISLNKTNATLIEGETLQLAATVRPNNATSKTVSWASSDDAVAMVDGSGLVTAIAPGSAAITATTTDGTNLSATCAVTVKEQVFSNSFSMPDTTVLHGETIVIPVRLNNEDEILSFQTDLFLPEGFSLAVDEDDEYLVTPSGRLSSDHILMAQSVGSGAVRLLCYAPNGTPFMGNEGDLFYLHIQVPDNAGGDYALNLRNSLLTLSDYNELSIPDVTAVLTVNTYIPGDVNDSHTVTVTDIVATAQYIMELNPSPFIFAAADMNGDGNVTVTDLMLIAYVVNHPTMSAPHRMPVLTAGSDRMSADGLNLMAGETRVVSIKLDNTMNYSAFQLDLKLPDGLTASNFALTDRASSHALDVNALANGKTRLLCYSPAIAAIEGDSGALLTFDVTANATVDAQIAVDGIELVTTDCRTVLLDGFTIGVNNATGANVIDGSKTVAHVDYYNLAGQRVERPESGVTLKVTTYTDGTRTTTKVIQ